MCTSKFQEIHTIYICRLRKHMIEKCVMDSIESVTTCRYLCAAPYQINTGYDL